MTTQSRNARIAFYSGLAVLVSAVIFLGSCPGAKHWFATTLAHSGVSTRANPATDVPARPVADSNSPLRFEENQGQTAREVRFVSHGGGYELFLTPDEAVLALHPARRFDLSPRIEPPTLKHNAKLGRPQRQRCFGCDSPTPTRPPGLPESIRCPAEWTISSAKIRRTGGPISLPTLA